VSVESEAGPLLFQPLPLRGVRTRNRIMISLIHTATQAEEILAKGQADLIVVGRMALWDPYWPFHAARELQLKAALPTPHSRADIFATVSKDH